MNSRNDGQLLSDVASNGSEAAFEELVRRHGKMVLNQSRRLLSDANDADDATQAVFLVLWKKAKGLRHNKTIAAWLHQVTRNVCSNARRAKTKRQIKEQNLEEMKQKPTHHQSQWDEIKNVLDDELDRLPEKYRLPLILFHFENRHFDEIALLLHTNSSTVGTRLRRGREMLRSRISRRGFAIGTTPLMLMIAANAGAADMPASAIAATVQSTSLFAAGKTVSTTMLSTQTITLAKGTLHMLAVAKFKMAAVTVASALVLVGGSAAVVNPSLLKGAPRPEALNATQSSSISATNANDSSTQDDESTVDWKTLSDIEQDRLAKDHLHSVAYAIHAYIEDNEGKLPPASVPNPRLDPSKRLSGFVLLLPYLGVRPSYIPEDDAEWKKRHAYYAADRSLYKTIDLKKGWDDPSNSEAAKTIVKAFLAPGSAAYRDTKGYAVSHFAFVRGSRGRDNGVFPLEGETILAIPDIRDGTINALAMGQINKSLGPWIAAGSSTARYIDHPTEEQKYPGFGSQHPGAAYFANADAFTYFWDMNATKPAFLHNIAGRADGKVNNRRAYSRHPSAIEWKNSQNKTGGKN